MTGNYLKQLVLFFLSGSAIVCAAGESTVDTDSPPVYKEEDYEKVGDLGKGAFGVVSKVIEKKTGKIYALKTFNPEPRGYEHAENEINALKQLDHGNIVKMITNNLGARSEDESVHLVLEHMPCNLYRAIQDHPEIKENKREILYQVLSGVAHIHSKKVVHGDLKLMNILVDPTTMIVKICDFGSCYVEELLLFPNRPAGGYYDDILSLVSLMKFLCFGQCFLDWRCLENLSRDEKERFLEAQRNGVLPPSNKLKTVYEELRKVVSENGLDLFLELVVSKREGGCTTAADALRHPFFAEGREQDPLPEEPKQRRAPYTYSRRNPNYSTNKTQQ
ncbi:MAG: CMGC protein kinase [Amphiamblys sp. WSBS2006]|nr:MAG: CMGC protein kinase [Amphiamblys sp. WSBS2006]